MLTVNSFFKKERDVLFKWGVQEGIEQGLERGRQERTLEMARKLKAKGLSVNEISEITGLSVQEIFTL